MAYNSKNSIYAEPFSVIPNALIRDGEISANAKTLYTVLKSYANNDGWGAYPGREKVAEHMGCSVKTVERAITELEKGQWIFVERGRNEHGNWTSNRYILAMTKGHKPRRPK